MYSFNENKFKTPKGVAGLKSTISGNPEKTGKGETMRYLYAVVPKKVKDLILLQGIELETDEDFKNFVDWYENDILFKMVGKTFDADKFLNTIVVKRAEIWAAKKNFANNQK